METKRVDLIGLVNCGLMAINVNYIVRDLNLIIILTIRKNCFSRFPDPKVRAYAVQLLDDLVDEELRSYLLQLVQCLKHEAYHDSALSRFLVCRAVQRIQ